LSLINKFFFPAQDKPGWNMPDINAAHVEAKTNNNVQLATHWSFSHPTAADPVIYSSLPCEPFYVALLTD